MKKKKNVGVYISGGLYTIIGAIVGVIAANLSFGDNEEVGVFQVLKCMMMVVLIGGVGIYLQIIIHEFGHLVFGLLTGYKFSSFRIGSFMWIKDNGKIKFRKFSLAGTGGQCILIPPNMINGKIPVFWYNFGGGLMNIITAIIFGIIYRSIDMPDIIKNIVLVCSIWGFCIAIINLVPLNMGLVNNDGYNILELSKSDEARKAFWIQFKINEMTMEGISLKDMPKEWFYIPSDESMKSSLIATIAVGKCSRLLNEGKFVESYELMQKLVKQDNAITGAQRNLLICDCIYCELIGDRCIEKINEMYTDELKKFMNAMKNCPTIIRTQYLYELFVNKDNKKAKEIEKKFEKIAEKYPYQCEIKDERKLINIAIEGNNI